MELDLSLRQGLALSPQMMQSMEILQMTAAELGEYLQELSQENPVIELEPQEPSGEEFSVVRRKLEWLEATDTQNTYYHRQDAEEDEGALERCGAAYDPEDSLYFHLLLQLPRDALPPPAYAAACAILHSLNGDGLLDEPLSALGVPEETALTALRAVQALEPAGVGARSLSECLLLQLERLPGDHTLAKAVARSHLDALGKSHYHQIAKALCATQEAVRSACDEIRALNPRPGAAFAQSTAPHYITPDIIVAFFGDHFELFCNDSGAPMIQLSHYYTSLAKQTDDEKVKDYLTGKLRQARWVVSSIEQRRKTLLRCAEAILNLQPAFFQKGPGHLLPMTLADVARQVGVHESTVSRAVRGKYIQCPLGVFALSDFFSRSLSGDTSGGASPDAAKALLRRLIEAEPPQKPLSDQKLCERMADEGVALSRRTVAKYRDELGIPAATGRKQIGK